MSTEEVQSIKETLHRIESALVGDPAMGHKGIAQRLDTVEQRTDAHDRKLLVWGGAFTGASVVLTHLKTKFLG